MAEAPQKGKQAGKQKAPQSGQQKGKPKDKAADKNLTAASKGEKEKGRGAEVAAEEAPVETGPREPPRLQKRYVEVLRPQLAKEFGYKNPMQVPKLEKVVLNIGVGEASADQKRLDSAVAELTLIGGQKAVKTVAKKAIAGFKIRKGLPIGCMVTLRRARMYEFLDRLINIAMPRVRDFRGIPAGKGFDGRGNFAMGLREQIVFPEINYDRVDAVRGLDIVFVTTAKTDAEAKALLRGFDLPFAG